MEIMQFMLAAAFNITANDIGLPTSTQNIGQGIANITVILTTLVGMLSVIFIIVGGIQFTYARGNAKSVERARETILYACVGLVLAIASYAVVTFISGSVKR